MAEVRDALDGMTSSTDVASCTATTARVAVRVALQRLKYGAPETLIDGEVASKFGEHRLRRLDPL